MTRSGGYRIEDDNFFLSSVLAGGMYHRLTADEKSAYLAPYPTPSSRHPIWAFVRQIPISGDAADVRDALLRNLSWLESTHMPRLLLYAEPTSWAGR